ncbi:MAG TPA: zf-HC2 domain-containing protein [Acidimicrobiia bacterium]|nr:zf-HC2 domain-containing protein [Acidimicrobiia bacterium]
MIRCSDAVRRLWEFVENDLKPGERQKIEEHLAFCRRCCGELEFAEELRRFMARRPTVDIPAPVLDRFDRLIRSLELEGQP